MLIYKAVAARACVRARINLYSLDEISYIYTAAAVVYRDVIEL